MALIASRDPLTNIPQGPHCPTPLSECLFPVGFSVSLPGGYRPQTADRVTARSIFVQLFFVPISNIRLPHICRTPTPPAECPGPAFPAGLLVSCSIRSSVFFDGGSPRPLVKCKVAGVIFASANANRPTTSVHLCFQEPRSMNPDLHRCCCLRVFTLVNTFSIGYLTSFPRATPPTQTKNDLSFLIHHQPHLSHKTSVDTS